MAPCTAHWALLRVPQPSEVRADGAQPRMENWGSGRWHISWGSDSGEPGPSPHPCTGSRRRGWARWARASPQGSLLSGADPVLSLACALAILLAGLGPAQGRHWLGLEGQIRRSDSWGAPSRGPWHMPGVCTWTQASISHKFLRIGMGRGWPRAAHHPWPAEGTSSPAQRT